MKIKVWIQEIKTLYKNTIEELVKEAGKGDDILRHKNLSYKKI